MGVFLSRHQRRRKSGRKSSYEPTDVWPGYIDMLANALLMIVFLWLLFILFQRALGWQLQETDSQLALTNGAIDTALRALGIEVGEDAELRVQALGNAVQATLRARQRANTGADVAIRASGRIQALEIQIAALNEALLAAEELNEGTDAVVFEGGQRLNTALATTAQEIARYRSVFFQDLDQALQGDSHFEVQGDRFVFRSDVLFAAASAHLNDSGRHQLEVLSDAVLDLEYRIDSDVPWIIRVDGHTDIQPIASLRFPSNWELSTSRALAVVRYLQDSGVRPERLAATGFSQYHPVRQGRHETDFRYNRRIEITLTRR